MATIKELTEKVQQWSIDRGLDKADPLKQCLKLIEEYGELVAGFAKGNYDLIKDSIGDMMVVITILAQQLKGETQYEIFAQPLTGDDAEIKQWQQSAVLDLIFYTSNAVMHLREHRTLAAKEAVYELPQHLNYLCLTLDLDLEECFQLAYDEIKDRKGKMVDGVFIKEADLK